MLCLLYTILMFVGGGFFFFKQKTAYEMRISDWSSDVCSSDLSPGGGGSRAPKRQRRRASGVGWTSWTRCHPTPAALLATLAKRPTQIGRASCRERVCQYV